MVHAELAQNESCVAALAYPPAESRPTFVYALSEARCTWYSGPLYAPNSARVVLCAPMHGVPPAAYRSHARRVGGGPAVVTTTLGEGGPVVGGAEVTGEDGETGPVDGGDDVAGPADVG